MIRIPRTAVIRLHLFKQGLYSPPTGTTPADALALLKRLGCIQLDTLNVLTRSQHLAFWSRMQHFREEWLLDLYRDRQIFEHYLRALCIVPTEEHIYIQPALDRYRQRWEREATPERRRLMDEFHQLLQQRGALTAREMTAAFGRGPERKEIWATSPVRAALDDLWRLGLAWVIRDARFQKVYHLPDPQIDAALRQKAATPEESARRYLLLALQAIGVASEQDLLEYFRLRRSAVQAALRQLLQEGAIRQVEVEGEPAPCLISPADLDLLDSPALAEEPSHAAFLSPFDNLVWNRDRTERFWGARYRLESYVPEAKRQFGYFALLILIRGRLVGTIDLKAERARRQLVVQKAVLFEPATEAEYAPEIAAVTRRLMTFLGLDHLTAAPGAFAGLPRLASM